jgi:hypothetical protein
VVDLERLERVLIQAALEERPVTYGQVLAFFGWKVTQVTVGALCRDLGRVEERRAAEGWPDLACLVVRKSDHLPGEGYFASLRSAGLYQGPSVGPAAEAFVRSRQQRAAHWARERAGSTRSPSQGQRDAAMSAASRCR